MKGSRKTVLFAVGALLTLAFTLSFFNEPASCVSCPNPGVGSPGYWMEHPEAWPVEEITIGYDTFTKAEAIAIMQSPVAGDKTYTMFNALVAAILNVRIGNCECDFNVWALLGETQSWFKSYPLGSGVTADSDAWQYSHGEKIYWRLDYYNNGLTCAPSRD